MKMRRILAPTDFSPTSGRALDYAVDLARALGAEVILMHAVEPVALAPDVYGASAIAPMLDEIERAARRTLDRIVAKLAKRRVRCRTALLTGPAATTIADAAAKLDADVIVMATHGRSGLSHLFLGSVAERVVRSARCPVLTVPERSQRGRKAKGKRRRSS
jgi:universal stress protein A